MSNAVEKTDTNVTPIKAKAASIYEAIPLIKADLAKIGVGKDATNQKDRFHYRSIYAIQTAVCAIEAKHGVFCFPSTTDIDRFMRQTAKGGSYPVTVASVVYTLAHSSGSTLDIHVEGEGADYGDKGTSKAMTGAFKTLLNQIYNIPYEAHDPDAESIGEGEDVARITEEQAATLTKYLDQMNKEDAARARKYLATSLKVPDGNVAMLRADAYEQVKGWFSKKVDG